MLRHRQGAVRCLPDAALDCGPGRHRATQEVNASARQIEVASAGTAVDSAAAVNSLASSRKCRCRSGVRMSRPPIACSRPPSAGRRVRAFARPPGRWRPAGEPPDLGIQGRAQVAVAHLHAARGQAHVFQLEFPRMIRIQHRALPLNGDAQSMARRDSACRWPTPQRGNLKSNSRRRRVRTGDPLRSARIRPEKRFPAKSNIAQHNGTQSSMVVHHRPDLSNHRWTERIAPAPRGASCPSSKPCRSNAGSTKCRQTEDPAHRAKSSAWTSFPAATCVPTRIESNPSRVRRKIQ